MYEQREQVLADRYLLEQRLGAGGMGEVWRAYDRRLRRRVAIKTVLTAGDESWVERALAEAQTLARLEHPNIVPVHDAFVHDGRPFVVMKYLRGRDLGSLTAARPAKHEILGYMINVSSALIAAHRVGIVHRDIKPANIIVDEQRQAHLVDFGIALNPQSRRLTEKGQIIGTTAFMAPEIIVGHDATPKSDMWSLGIVIFACLNAGTTPFGRDAPIATAYAILNNPIPVVKDDPTGLIGRLLNRRAELRPSAAEVLAALGSAATRIEPLYPVTKDRERVDSPPKIGFRERRRIAAAEQRAKIEADRQHQEAAAEAEKRRRAQFLADEERMRILSVQIEVAREMTDGHRSDLDQFRSVPLSMPILSKRMQAMIRLAEADAAKVLKAARSGNRWSIPQAFDLAHPREPIKSMSALQFLEATLAKALYELEESKFALDKLIREPPLTEGYSERMKRMIRLAVDESKQIVARAEEEADRINDERVHHG